MKKKYAYIDNDFNRYYNVEFYNYEDNCKLKSDIKIKEITVEEWFAYDLMYCETISLNFEDYKE